MTEKKFSELSEDTEKTIIAFNELKFDDDKEKEKLYKEEILYSSALLYDHVLDGDRDGFHFNMAEIFTLSWSFIKNDEKALKTVMGFMNDMIYIKDKGDDYRLKIRHCLAVLISCESFAFGESQDDAENALKLLKSCIMLLKLYNETIYDILIRYPEICDSYENSFNELGSNLIFIDNHRPMKKMFMN